MPAQHHGASDIVRSTLTRRKAVTSALAATSLLAATRTAPAQEATPEPAGQASFLFLQACESGSATPAGDAGVYDLTLVHASGQTLFFADRPERIAGIVPTDAFLDEMGTMMGDPPNAALAFSVNGSSDAVEVAVVELRSPKADAGTISYQIRVIDSEQGQQGDAAEGDTIETVKEFPASFGQATVFIDDLGDTYLRRNLSDPLTDYASVSIGIGRQDPYP